MATIYALLDPDSKIIRYVGVTKLTLATRLGAHIRKARLGEKNHRASWLRKLAKEEKRPLIKVIEETDDRNREIFWIQHFRDLGLDLINATLGGDGCKGLSLEARMRIGEATRKRVVTSETRQKLSNSLKGKRLSEETKEKIRQRLQGRMGKPWTPEQKVKSRTSKLGHSVSPETRHKISAALTGRSIGRKRTHCLAGHAYDEKNTFVNIRGAQECKTCRSTRDKKRYLSRSL